MAYAKKKEYIIWGKVGDNKYEDILVSEKANIKSMKEAKQIIDYLEKVHNCRECRVLVIDGTKPDFISTISKTKKRK
jgi:hypothetical protein